MIITLDAGHGPGKNSNRGSLIGHEGDNNYLYSLVLKEALEAYQDVRVILTRNKNTDNPTLKERGAMAKGSELLLSLHSNAFNGSAHGVSIFDSVQKPNKVLATALLNALSTFWKKRDVNYKVYPGLPNQDYYAILRESGAKSSMMIEHGFHDVLSDVKIYTTKRKEIAQTTAQTIAKHYGLKLKGTPPPATGKLYRVQVGAYSIKENAEKLAKELQEKGYATYITYR